QINDKAQGFFLWVSLLVRSLREGGDDIDTLSARIRLFPVDLEEFFKHIMDSIDIIQRVRMATYSHIVLHAQTSLPLILYSFIDECARDEHIPLHRAITPMNVYELHDRHAITRRRVNGACKGLL